MNSIRRAYFFVVLLAAAPLGAQPPVVWTFSSPAFAAPAVPSVDGTPRVNRDGTPPSIAFDGRADGFELPINPVASWPRFTIRARIRPAADGPAAQRFLHIEDAAGRRITMELRLGPDGNWSLDTFLRNTDQQKRTLHQAGLIHSSGQWHEAVLRYDGKTMSSAVDGKPELSGPVNFPPMTAGRTSVGVRLNRIYWFKGEIAELSFSPQ